VEMYHLVLFFNCCFDSTVNPSSFYYTSDIRFSGVEESGCWLVEIVDQKVDWATKDWLWMFFILCTIDVFKLYVQFLFGFDCVAPAGA